MSTKKIVSKMLEIYINDFKKDVVEEFYGKNSKIKIHTITESITDGSVMVEAFVSIGEVEITEEVVDELVARLLIQDAMTYMGPKSELRTMIRFDS